MRPSTATVLLLSGAAVWLHQAVAVAGQDLALRPVALAASRESPLPDERALPRLEAAALRMPGRADALLRFAERLDASGDRERAADLYGAAARAFPAWGLGQYRLAMAALRGGDEPGARHHMRVASDCAGNHPALLMHLGEWHLELWKRIADPAALLDAVDYFRMAVRREPGCLREVYASIEPVLADPMDLGLVTPPDPDSRLLLGLHLASRGRAAEALAVLDALTGTFEGPRGRELRLARGRSLLALDRVEEGLAALREGLDGVSGEEVHRVLPGVERVVAGLPAPARVSFWKDVPGAGPFFSLALARALVEAGDHRGAMGAADAAIRALRPGTASPRGGAERRALVAAYDLRMRDWIRRKAPLQAAAEAVKAARIEDTPGRWRVAARLFADSGDSAAARRAWERALRAVPKESPARASEIEEEMLDRLTRPGGGRSR